MRIDLTKAKPEECIKAIIEMVEDIVENEDNWEDATMNTPFTGDVAGMDIPSADIITVSNDLKKIFHVNGEAITITEEEANVLATPGICVKFFMEKGYMEKDDEFLKDVVSFGYISAAGVGYRVEKEVKTSINRCQSWVKASKTGTENAFRRLMAKASPGQSKAELAQDDLSKLKDCVNRLNTYVQAVQNPEQILNIRKESLKEKEAQFEEIKNELNQDAEDSSKKNSLKVKMQKALPPLLIDRESIKTLGNPKEVDLKNTKKLISYLEKTMQKANETATALESCVASL